jgi:hypothetical protein
VVAREAVGAVGAQQHQRQLVERRREAREQLERRLVGPLEVVEDDERGLADLGQRGADRLEDRRAVARRGLLAELGQQQREVRAERPQPREGAGPEAQVRAQGGDDRAVGETALELAAPRSTSTPEAAPASSARRVLPTPASPERSSSVPVPRRARSTAWPSSASWASRPRSAAATRV